MPAGTIVMDVPAGVGDGHLADGPAFRFSSTRSQLAPSHDRRSAGPRRGNNLRSGGVARRLVSRFRLVEHLNNTRTDPAEGGGIGRAQVVEEDVSNFRALRT